MAGDTIHHNKYSKIHCDCPQEQCRQETIHSLGDALIVISFRREGMGNFHLSQITQLSNRLRIDIILCIVLKIELICACFQRKAASANFGVSINCVSNADSDEIK